MRNRRFSFAASAPAHLYITHLLTNGYTFTVIPLVDRVDIITPFDLAPGDFPEPEGLLKATPTPGDSPQ
jgi:hypothetical protein